MARQGVRLDQIEPGMRVRFLRGSEHYVVTFVGPRYFHVQTDDGVSGPYGPELVDEVLW
jgi:hypothetical protein